MNHNYELPLHVMSCSPFLQRMGWESLRPEQNFNLSFDHLHIQQIPVEYPTQAVDQAPGFRTEPALHGVAQLQPYSEKEILKNSNYEK